MRRFKKTYPKTAKFIKGAGKAIQVASKAYSIAKTVAALVNSEKMIYQVVPTTFNISTTPQIFNLTPMVQGDGVGNRHGNVIALESMQIHYRINWYTPLTLNQIVRCMIVIDRNEETAEWSTPNTLLQSVNVIGLKNTATRAQFKVLYDKTFHYDGTAPAFNKKIYLKNPNSHRGKDGQMLRHHIVYNGNNTYGKGCMYIMFFSTLAANYPTGEVTWETKYFDN